MANILHRHQSIYRLNSRAPLPGRGTQRGDIDIPAKHAWSLSLYGRGLRPCRYPRQQETHYALAASLVTAMTCCIFGDCRDAEWM